MLFLARHYDLIRDREKTYLTASLAVAGTSLTVRAVDTNAWADNDYIIVGEIGSKTAELLQVNGAVSDGATLTVDQLGSGGARYAHSADEPVYRIDYNQVEFSRATTETGSKTVLATNEIQPDNEATRYEDTANSTGYGFVRFKNATTSVFSDYSDAIPYTGYTPKSLGRMLRMVRKNLGNPPYEKVDDEDIIDELNEGQREVAHERLWPFYETLFSASRVASQKSYDIDSDAVVGKQHGIIVDSQPMVKVGSSEFDLYFWDSTTSGESTHALVWENKIHLWPIPDTAASSTTLNGAITATATSLILTSASGFRAPGRLIIGTEVIGYETISSNTLGGLTRGLEETTAAAHSDLDAVTERDIIYRAHKEPDDLVDISDETAIPDPAVLIHRATRELAIGKLQDSSLHDRYKLKHEEALKKLRDNFSVKSTSQFMHIKDRDEVISGRRGVFNNNDYPQNIGT